MRDIVQLLERWQLDVGEVRRRMYLASTPRERERWHALWLLALGWTASAVAEALERDSHTIGMWVTALVLLCYMRFKDRLSFGWRLQ